MALFRALGFQERLRTKHHGDSVEFQLPGENQPVFEIHRVGGEEAIGVNHIAFQVADVAAARKELQAQGLNASVEPVYVRATGRTVLNLRDPDGQSPGSGVNRARYSPSRRPRAISSAS